MMVVKKRVKRKRSVPENPIVARAKISIPRRWSKRLNHWIKAHKRTISLSAAAVLSLYGVWYAQKIGIAKAERRLKALQEATLNKRFSAEGKVASQAAQLGFDIGPRLKAAQKILGNMLKDREERLRIVELALANKDFHEFLKKKGYDDLRKVKQ